MGLLSITQRIRGVQRRITEIILMVSKIAMRLRQAVILIGLEGEIIQCIPTWEMAYASNDRNADTISIECCHPDENGKFTDATYRSLVQLTAWLCAKYDLTADQVIRHYDVTGKICPKYFVEDEDAWVEFRRNVQDALEKQ